MTHEQLVGVLEDLLAHVKERDSFEGSFEYSLPDPDSDEQAEVMVRAAYRIGNRQGQGGMRIVGRADSRESGAA